MVLRRVVDDRFREQSFVSVSLGAVNLRIAGQTLRRSCAGFWAIPQGCELF